MDEYQDQSTNGQVIIGAGVAAGVLAGVALLLSRRKSKPETPAERVSKTVEATVSQAKETGHRLLERAPAASAELERAGTEARRLFERRHQVGRDIAKEVGDQATRLRVPAQYAGEHAATSAQQIAAAAAAAAVERAERVLEAGAHLADAAREQAPRVAQRLGDEVAPALRDIASQAAEAAVERWHEARHLAADMPPVDFRQLESRASHLAAAGGGFARGTGTAVADRAADLSRRAAEATEHSVDRARDASKKGAEAASHARDASKRTAEATVVTGKDTGALLFWAGAAAGLIFYALLSAERREQISQSIQAVIKDIQGYDDEF